MADLIANPNYNPALGATAANQPYVFANPQTAVINPTTGQTAAQALTGTINSTALEPVAPIQLPPPLPQDNTAAGIFGGATQASKSIDDYIKMLTPPATAQSQQASDLTSQISALLEQDTERGQAQLAAEQTAGVPGISQQLGDLNAQILQKVAEQKMIDSEFQQQNVKTEGKVWTNYSIAGKEAQDYKTYLASRNANASELGLLQARALGVQGKLDAAQRQADRAVDLKYQDIESQINTKLKQLELLQGQLDKEEQRRAEALKLYLQDQQQKIQDQKDADKQIQNIMLTAASNNAPSNVLNAISSSKSLLEATQNAGPYLQSQSQQEVATPYYRVEGADEVFSSQTHQHVTAEEAATIPNFWSMVTLLPQGSPQPAYNSQVSTTIIESGGRQLLINSKTGETIKDLGGVTVSGGGGGISSGEAADQLYGGLTTPTATAVRARVNKFASEPIVQNFATIQDGYNFASAISNKTTNPADDQALIYSLAKALDPSSVVREGEYATAQKYAQSWIKAYGKGIEQAILGTGFLSEEARANIKQTIKQKYEASKKSYDNIYSQYEQGINSLTGRNDGSAFLTQYSIPQSLTMPIYGPEQTTPEAKKTESFWSKTYNWLFGE